MGGLKKWFGDAVLICRRELKRLVTDGGVMLIFCVAGLGYPLLYNCIYHNGILEDTPVAVVDESAASIAAGIYGRWMPPVNCALRANVPPWRRRRN